MFTLLNLYQQPVFFLTGLMGIMIWDLVWKGISLWFAAQNKQKGWFVTLLIFNTMGILPIIYLIWFKPKKEKIRLDKTKLDKFVEAAKKSAKRKAAKKKK